MAIREAGLLLLLVSRYAAVSGSRTCSNPLVLVVVVLFIVGVLAAAAAVMYTAWSWSWSWSSSSSSSFLLGLGTMKMKAATTTTTKTIAAAAAAAAAATVLITAVTGMLVSLLMPSQHCQFCCNMITCLLCVSSLKLKGIPRIASAGSLAYFILPSK